MDKVYQGEISIDGTTRITCSTTSLAITTIIILNPSSSYHFMLTKVTGEQTPLYRFDLDVGDTVRDTFKYVLNNGESLQLISNVKGTSYYINATEQL